MGAPSLYEELSRDPEALRTINKFHYVVASGGKSLGAFIKCVSRYLMAFSSSVADRGEPDIEAYAGY
jgi:hypothetical protein